MACDCFILSLTLILSELLQSYRLESVLVFLSQYPEISGITGALKLAALIPGALSAVFESLFSLASVAQHQFQHKVGLFLVYQI